MADIKISELTRVASLNNGDLVEVSQVNELAPSGYTSLSASMTDIGAKVNTDIEYTTDLADFSDKTIVGAINENKDNLDSLTSATLPYSTDPTEGTTKEKIDSKADKAWTQLANIKVTANTSQTVSTDITGFEEFLFVFGTNNASNEIVYKRSYVIPKDLIQTYVSDVYYADATYKYSSAARIQNITTSNFRIDVNEVSIGTPYQTNGLRFMLFAR